MTTKIEMRKRIPGYIKELTDGLDDEMHEVKVLFDDGNLFVVVLNFKGYGDRKDYTFFSNTFWSLQGFINIYEKMNGGFDINYHGGAWCDDTEPTEIAMIMSLAWSYVSKNILTYHAYSESA